MSGSKPSDGAGVAQELTILAEKVRQQVPYLRLCQLQELQVFTHYERVPPRDLDRSTERNVLRIADLLSGVAEKSSELLEEEDVSTRRRAEQGVPVEAIRSAHRSVVARLRDEWVTLAKRSEEHTHELPPLMRNSYA